MRMTSDSICPLRSSTSATNMSLASNPHTNSFDGQLENRHLIGCCLMQLMCFKAVLSPAFTETTHGPGAEKYASFNLFIQVIEALAEASFNAIHDDNASHLRLISWYAATTVSSVIPYIAGAGLGGNRGSSSHILAYSASVAWYSTSSAWRL
jgi:hypothetical protein